MANSKLDPWMVAISSHWIWAVILVILGAWALKSRNRWLLILIAGVLVGLSDLFAFEVSPSFERLRPCKDFSFVRIDQGCGGMFGFPSNHATNSMTFAVFMAQWTGRSVGIPLIIFAMWVAFSRVYLGVHYLGDITFGAILGFSWAVFAKQMIDKTAKLEGLRNKLSSL